MKALLRALHAPVYRRRLEVLVEILSRYLEPEESLLDVGCGAGTLGQALAEGIGVTVSGLETHVRDGCEIPVDHYDGRTIPHPDNSFDSVLLADMLHHEEDPGRVLREAARVARRRVVVKDHKVDGLLAHPRICLIDWAANAGYDIPCLFRYPTLEGWHTLFRECALETGAEQRSINLYPAGLNLLFGRRLQYLAVLEPAQATNPS